MTQSRWLLVSILTLLTVALVAPLAAQNDDQDTSEGRTTFNYGHPFRSGSLDPITENGSTEHVFFDLIFDTLVTVDAEGNLVPRLATEWALTDETVTFTLREGVSFSDGTPFNAAAARANLERAINEGIGTAQLNFRAVTEVEAVDTFTLRVHHDGSDPFLMDRFVEYSAMMVSPENFEEVGDNPIGTGPYTLNLDETVIGTLYVYDRNPDHWDNANIPMDRITIRVGSQTDLANGLLAGDLDGIMVTDSVTRTLPVEDFILLTEDITLYALAFWDRNGEMVPELADPEVRCALSQAIDVALFGEALAGAALDPMFTIPPTSWYGASGVTKPAYDPEAARATLEAAGLSDFTLPMMIWPASQPNHEALAGFLTEVGINVETNVLANDQATPAVSGGEVAAGYYFMNAPHFSILVDRYLAADGDFNPFGAVDEDLAALIEQTEGLSFEEAEPIYQDISRIVNERCYFVPLSSGSAAALISPEFENVEGRHRTNGFVNLRKVSFGS